MAKRNHQAVQPFTVLVKTDEDGVEELLALEKRRPAHIKITEVRDDDGPIYKGERQ